MSALFKRAAMMAGGNPSLDTPDQHGFFMLGTGTVFFYHSAQFTMENHAYQMIFTVDIPQSAKTTYVNDVEQNGASGDWVWIFNSTEPLSTLPQIQIGEVTALNGTILRLLKETTNPPITETIVESVTITIERRVYFRHFDYSQSYPNPPLPYLLFGDETGAYLAHYLTKQEDFDNVAVVARPRWLALEQLMAGAPVDFPTVPYMPGVLPVASPLVAGKTYRVQFGGMVDPSFTLDVQSIYWFDITDVNAPMSMGS